MNSRQRCSKCRKRTPIIGFATFRTRSGELRRRGVCAECRSKYAIENFAALQAWRREYNSKNRVTRQRKNAVRRAKAKAFVDKFKDKPCVDCGGRFPPVAMDLDHVRGAKVRGVASLVSGAYRLELIAVELAKCEVVCACCHRVRTAKRKANLAPPVSKVTRKRTGGSLRRRRSKGVAAKLDAERMALQ
jgi:hypothetical protein